MQQAPAERQCDDLPASAPVFG